jgi:hypothetical protein
MKTVNSAAPQPRTDGRRLCRAYYGGLVQAEEDEADAIYYSERDFWDHLARAARLAFEEDCCHEDGT